MTGAAQKNISRGIFLAVLATLLWSGNFIVAKAVNRQIPPVSLNFFRWFTASLIILPFAIKSFREDWPVIRHSWHYLFWVSMTGIALFNTFVYVGAHYTSAINLALIGTTSSPIMSVIFARIFLKEKIGIMKLAGLLLCIIGVLTLLSNGKWENLLHLHFGTGDLWVLLAAFCFSIYNTLVKKKPSGIKPLSFLLTTFAAGTLMVVPFFWIEWSKAAPVVWDYPLVLSVLYLGLFASVVCFYIWNIAIGELGAGRTALFGNLIPVFSSIEAAILLHESFTTVHIISMAIVFTGIAVANYTTGAIRLTNKAPGRES
ncbi:MAG: DMT family transporter [Chitinophagaceae bacterium]|nr:DMT family transporter [Chitinophagaceae bacterium]